MPPRPDRPPDADYYEHDRVELFSQGDLFRDVPLAYPLPADELVVDEAEREPPPLPEWPARVRSGDADHAELLDGRPGDRRLRPPGTDARAGIPLAELIERGVIKETALEDLRRFDHLINYMYLPPLDVDELEFSMPESVALLYMPVTLHHVFLEGQRVSQLAYRGAQQLQRKLVWFYSGWLEDDLGVFDPPMD